VHRARPAPAASAVLAAALLLTACGTGGSTGSGLPTVGATSSTTAATTATDPTTSTPAPDPSPWTALPTISEGPNKGVYNGVVLASSVAKTDKEKAAVDAYLAFWEYIAKAGRDVRVDKQSLAEVASGGAASNVESYIEGLRSKKAQTIGWVSVNVTTVTVGTNAVLLTACVDNGSFDVDRSSGKRLEKGSPGYDGQAAVRSIGGRLVVTSSRAPKRTARCAVTGG
jgi:hypothetical protein